ncbi:hypothetical protein NPIL_610681 [Nephila pilipes]|uniref:Uncharacterized protein n=1 Tax=Nephila pilipes TaxID=299642 RepID=A0A8X6QTD7_NEPPI|nr:hypothetical protein NPIL_610681 [Nephila pilipes]
MSLFLNLFPRQLKFLKIEENSESPNDMAQLRGIEPREKAHDFHFHLERLSYFENWLAELNIQEFEECFPSSIAEISFCNPQLAVCADIGATYSAAREKLYIFSENMS